jgi:hypothetical protein
MRQKLPRFTVIASAAVGVDTIMSITFAEALEGFSIMPSIHQT